MRQLLEPGSIVSPYLVDGCLQFFGIFVGEQTQIKFFFLWLEYWSVIVSAKVKTQNVQDYNPNSKELCRGVFRTLYLLVH